MSIRAKVISIVAAASLVAGAGLAVAAPAQAKNHIKGTTKITLDADIAAALASIGVTLKATDGGTTKGRTLIFPVTGAGDGYVSHRGQLQFLRAGTITASGNNPLIEWPTDQPLTRAIIKVDAQWGPPGTRLGLFTVTDIELTNLPVKVNKSKKTRTITTVIRGNLTVSEPQANLLNNLLQTPLLQADMPLGKTITKLVLTSKCKNKACTR